MVERVGDVQVGEERPGVAHDPGDVAAHVEGVRRAVEEGDGLVVDADRARDAEPRRDRTGTATDVEQAHLWPQVGKQERGPPIGRAAAVGRAMAVAQEPLVVLQRAQGAHPRR